MTTPVHPSTNETSLPFSKPFSKLSWEEEDPAKRRRCGENRARRLVEKDVGPRRACDDPLALRFSFKAGGKDKSFERARIFVAKARDIFVFFVFFGFFGRTTNKKERSNCQPKSEPGNFCVKKNVKTERFLVRFYSCIPKCYVLQIRNKAPSFSAPRCDAKSEARERTEENNAIVSASSSSSSSSRWSAPWT